MDNSHLLGKLKKALTRARLDWHEVWSAVRAGECQFIEVPGAIAITSIRISGKYRTCYCMAVAGDWPALPALEAKVIAFARREFCQVVEADGRPGWGRIHGKLATGYELSTVKFRKTLEYNDGRTVAAEHHDAD